LDAAVDATGRIAAGDLTVSLEETSEDEIGQLISSLNMMAVNLASLVASVKKSGIQVTSSSTEIAATAKQQEATVTEQAATANQISTTATEISTTAQGLVQTMDEVTGVTETTANAAADSQTALASMEQTMHHMMDATGNIGSKLSVLSEKASNINSVVTTITKVADQTNLLSLNAAIEAEKAGEYGVGFSVVATEIRRLADQTAVATWDIEQMVKEMQTAVAAGVMGMDKFTEEVKKGVDEVRHVGVQLADIIEQVQALLPRFEAVYEGMQNQALGAQQITESISQLSDGTHQTAESLRQSSDSIAQLNNAARMLQDGVSKFKIKERQYQN
jgi:methyl-accepting chemotaxis protein WspA